MKNLSKKSVNKKNCGHNVKEKFIETKYI
jgi:hypothetical protein